MFAVSLHPLLRLSSSAPMENVKIDGGKARFRENIYSLNFLVKLYQMEQRLFHPFVPTLQILFLEDQKSSHFHPIFHHFFEGQHGSCKSISIKQNHIDA